MDKCTTYLSQTHYAEEIQRTYSIWNDTPHPALMQPNTRLNKDDCDKSPAPDFHRRYHDADDCSYYRSWRNNAVIVFGTLSSFLT